MPNALYGFDHFADAFYGLLWGIIFSITAYFRSSEYFAIAHS